MHAKGALEFRLPVGWQLQEVPEGRTIRVVISPPSDAKGERENDPADQAWIVYHRRTRPSPAPVEEILREIDDRISLATNAQGLPAQDPQRFVLAGYPAVRKSFEIAGDSGDGPSLGTHLLARTDWGLLELHATARRDASSAVFAAVDEIVAGIAFLPPVAASAPVKPALDDARPALGAWKALRSRLVIDGNGHIAIYFDRQGIFDLDETGKLQYDNRQTELRGQFRADGDLIKVVWEDGSRLNYRFRVHGDDLLLTDHHGRTSQLARLFD